MSERDELHLTRRGVLVGAGLAGVGALLGRMWPGAGWRRPKLPKRK